MPNLLSAKRCLKRKIAPADQLKAVDDIDMPFTMSALETIINFGQIFEINTKEGRGGRPLVWASRRYEQRLQRGGRGGGAAVGARNNYVPLL